MIKLLLTFWDINKDRLRASRFYSYRIRKHDCFYYSWLLLTSGWRLESYTMPVLPPIWLPISLLLLLSLQSCLTLCDPLDGSPPGSPVPGILQARTLEWVAISFSNAWKWKVNVKPLSCVRLFATAWTAAYQAPLAMGFSRQEYWSGVPLPSLPISLGMAKKHKLFFFFLFSYDSTIIISSYNSGPPGLLARRLSGFNMRHSTFIKWESISYWPEKVAAQGFCKLPNYNNL